VDVDAVDDRVVLTVTVQCGVQLPKPQRRSSGEIISPFVELYVVGMPCDDTRRARKSTTVVTHNGFNPEWHETFVWHIRYAAMALLMIEVRDQDVLSNEFIADSGCPVTSIRHGYRCIPLHATDAPLPHPTCLICHFSVKHSDGSNIEHPESPTRPSTKYTDLDPFTQERLNML
jgi:hypothetical protein